MPYKLETVAQWVNGLKRSFRHIQVSESHAERQAKHDRPVG